MKNKKAQSAMEYLMTYGWAILIVIIVAAALYALGVFNPSTLTGKRSTGFPNLGAPTDWQYAGTTFTIVMTNNAGKTVTISQAGSTVNCGASGGAVALNYTDASSTWGAGASKTFQATGCADLASGAYSLTVNLNYTTGTFYNIEQGTVTGSV